jgi:hypothetical protein
VIYIYIWNFSHKLEEKSPTRGKVSSDVRNTEAGIKKVEACGEGVNLCHRTRTSGGLL